MLDAIFCLAFGTFAILFRRPWARWQVAVWDRTNFPSWLHISERVARGQLLALGVFFLAVAVLILLGVL